MALYNLRHYRRGMSSAMMAKRGSTTCLKIFRHFLKLFFIRWRQVWSLRTGNEPWVQFVVTLCTSAVDLLHTTPETCTPWSSLPSSASACGSQSILTCSMKRYAVIIWQAKVISVWWVLVCMYVCVFFRYLYVEFVSLSVYFAGLLDRSVGDCWTWHLG